MKINLVWRENVGYIGTIKDYVDSFTEYSKHNIIVSDWNKLYSGADIMILHYSIMHAILFPHEKVRKNAYIKFFQSYKGKVVVIIQDEYYDVNVIRIILKLIKVDLILSCIPKEHHRTIYNSTPEARIERVLTGYVPEKIEIKIPQKIKGRKHFIFYRGKNLPYYYGKLGQWKKYIGIKMKEYCDNKGISCNIGWNEKDKLFGSDWINTMHDSKVTLATPSGLNVFHYDKQIINQCNRKEKYVNGYTYEMAEKEFNLQDGPIKMGQVSPKMFEAAMCGTVLVMYPGEYNGIFKKDVHYIELQPDFSNIEEVMSKIQDDDFLQKMSDRTYNDIVKSGKYSYKSFIERVDGWIDRLGNYDALLIWYDKYSYIGTINDYVCSFEKNSNLNILKYDLTKLIQEFVQDGFHRSKYNSIILHYSIIHGVLHQINIRIKEILIKFLRNAKCKIIVIIQDEYYDINVIRNFLNTIQPDLILSCIPTEHQRTIYNTTPLARIERVLTGYVPERNEIKIPQKIKARKHLIFYRGKNLPYFYGKLGQWKKYIGIKMKEYCDSNGIPSNIGWNESDKLYGSEWINTMHDSKVTLATPSGLNVFHYDNKIINACNWKEKNIPGYTYEMAKKEFNLQDGPIKMGQISPKMFEAAMCGTVLVMYPGEYNGIFKKDIHYIELQPDFSNIEEVMSKIQDDDFLQKMSDRTYNDIVKSGKYSYKSFIEKVDGWINEL